MKKNNCFMIAIFTIAAIVYNIVMFFVITRRDPIFWSSYTFTMIAFVAVTVVYLLAIGMAKSRDTAFLNIPTIIIATIYFFVQLAVGFVLIFSPNVFITYINILQIVIIALALILILASLIGKNSVNTTDEKTNFIRNMSAEIEVLINKISDKALQNQLEKLYDTVRYSNQASNPSLAPIEQEIENNVSDLIYSVNGQSQEISEKLCKEIAELFSERNRQCKNRRGV